MEIRQLRYFLDVAQTEHLTRSAERLFASQSALSHGIRQLEEELGVTLFDRIGRGLKLTQAGAEFRRFASRALHEMEAGRQAVSALGGLQTGRLTVGAFPTLLDTLVPVAVAAFNRAYPGVVVEVRSLRAGAIETALAGGDLDLGIAFHPTAATELEVEPLFDERMLLVVASRHPLARRPAATLASLQGLPAAMLPRSYVTRRMIDQRLAAARVTVDVQVEIEPVSALLEVCRDTRLATIAPDRAVLRARGVTGRVFEDLDFVRRVALLWRRDASRSAAAQAFADQLRAARA